VNKENVPQSLFTVATPSDPDLQRYGRACQCRQYARSCRACHQRTNSEPSLATASAAGRPHTSARCSPDIQKPVLGSLCYSPKLIALFPLIALYVALTTPVFRRKIQGFREAGMKTGLLGTFLLSLASTTAGSQTQLHELVARAKSLELNTPYVPPPGDPLAHHAAGYAKVMCSAVFIRVSRQISLLRMSDFLPRRMRSGQFSVSP